MVVAKQISPSTKHIHTVENTLKVLHKEDVKSSPEKSNQRECNISFQIGKMLLQEVTEELDKEWRAKISVWVRLDTRANF